MATLTLDPFTDADPCPRVGLTIAGVVGTQSVTVYRTAAGQRLVVRGLSGRSVSTADYVVDYEVPLSQTVTYELYVGGVLNDTESTTVASSSSWLQDPLAPSQAVQISSDTLFAGGAFASVAFPGSATMFDVMGADYPVALGGVRAVGGTVPFPVITETVQASEKVRALLSTGGVVLLRPAADVPALPRVAFLSVSSIEMQPLDAHVGGVSTRWVLGGSLVTPPAVSVVVPVWSYGDVNALWSTYNTVKGGTYLDWLRDPTP